MLLLIRGKSAMDWIEIRIWYMFSNMRKELILQYDHLLFQTWFSVSLTMITSLEIKFPMELFTQSWYNGRYSYVQNFKNLGRCVILDLLVLSALFFKHIFITTLSCVGIIDSFGFWTWQTRLSSFCYFTIKKLYYVIVVTLFPGTRFCNFTDNWKLGFGKISLIFLIIIVSIWHNFNWYGLVWLWYNSTYSFVEFSKATKNLEESEDGRYLLHVNV